MLFDKDLLQYEKKQNFINVKYNNTILAITVSSVRIPFGIKELVYNNSNKNYNLQISIDNKNDKLSNLLNFIIKLEKHAKEMISDDEILEDKKFMSRIYYSDNSPLIRLDLKNDTLIRDKNNNKIPLQSYLNKSLIGSISFSYLGIYISKNIGLSFKIDSIIIEETKDKTNKITNFNF
jgi:hypothetical protein